VLRGEGGRRRARRVRFGNSKHKQKQANKIEKNISKLIFASIFFACREQRCSLGTSAHKKTSKNTGGEQK
jgi:hypothetical protein